MQRLIASVTGSDTTLPVITLNGDNPSLLKQGNTYVEAGASAEDDKDGNVSVAISSAVDTNIVGTYIITYTATDAANNTSPQREQ